MAGPEDLDDEARALYRAAEAAGVDYAIEPSARPGEVEIAWLRLIFPRAAYLYARGRMFHASDGRHAFGPHVNGGAARVTSHKAETLAILRARQLSVPEGRLFRSDEQDAALAYALHLKSDVCIKPNAGSKGLYVYPGLREPARILAAFRKAKRLSGGVLVERSLEGEVLRHFYVAPRVVATKCNRLPEVVGDGSRTIAQLTEARNARMARLGSYSQKPIKTDVVMLKTLRDQGYTPETVLEAGERATLNLLSNTSAGGEAQMCSDIHASYAEIAARACAAIPNLKISAVDMIVNNRTSIAACDNYWILELNSSPGCCDFADNSTTGSDNVCARILAFLADNSSGYN